MPKTIKSNNKEDAAESPSLSVASSSSFFGSGNGLLKVPETTLRRLMKNCSVDLKRCDNVQASVEVKDGDPESGPITSSQVARILGKVGYKIGKPEADTYD